MKKTAATILMVLFLLVTGVAGAETQIVVSGSGETQVTADTAVISLGVSARDQDVLKAQQKVNATIAAIRKALTEQGVKEDCINTDYLNIYAVYDYANESEQIAAYNANSTLAVRVTDMESTGTLIDAAFAAGANTLNGISFSASHTEEAKAESLRKAVAQARAHAEVLAEAAGLRITGMEVISDQGVYSYGNSVGNFSAKSMYAAEETEEDAGTVVQAAKLIVNATVSITFTAE